MAVNHDELTTNHVPHTDTYANAAARLAASGFVAGDVGKLYVQSDARRPLFRLAATTPTWDAVVPTGKNVIFVDAAGEGDYALLSDALAAITTAADAAIGNQYTVIVNGVIEETATVDAISYVHVQGLAGASLQVTPGSSGPGVLFDTVVTSVWKDLDVQALGANALQGVKLMGCDTTVKLVNITASTATAASKAIEITTGEADARLSQGIPEADWIADAQGAFGTSRPGEARTYAAMLVGETSGAVTAELLTLQGDRLVLPNLSAWVFDGWIVARNASANSEAAGYHVIGCIRREATAASTKMIGTVTKTVVGEEAAVSDWDVALTEDTTNGSLKVEGTGAAGDDVQWVCTLVITQTLVAVV